MCNDANNANRKLETIVVFLFRFFFVVVFVHSRWLGLSDFQTRVFGDKCYEQNTVPLNNTETSTSRQKQQSTYNCQYVPCAHSHHMQFQFWTGRGEVFTLDTLCVVCTLMRLIIQIVKTLSFVLIRIFTIYICGKGLVVVGIFFPFSSFPLPPPPPYSTSSSSSSSLLVSLLVT